VLGVDGPDALVPRCLHHQRASHDKDFLGRQRYVLSRFERRKRRRQRSGARDGDDDQVATRVGHHRLDPRVKVRFARLALDEVLGGALGRPPALREAEQQQACGIPIDHIERLLADRPCGAENRDVDWARHLRMWNIVT